jgi:hypothetical protein
MGKSQNQERVTEVLSPRRSEQESEAVECSLG